MWRKTGLFAFGGLMLMPWIAWGAGPGADGGVSTPSEFKHRIAACTSCHGEQGQGDRRHAYPRLAGQPPGYLLKQLKAFRAGERPSGVMQRMVEGLPDSYLRQMAGYFSRQHPAASSARPRDRASGLMALGQGIATRGVPQAGVPPCAICHGSDLAGSGEGVAGEPTPGLAGQWAPYLARRLRAWQSGAAASAVMQPIAQRLTGKDIRAVSAYLAAQPAGEASMPAPGDTAPSTGTPAARQPPAPGTVTHGAGPRARQIARGRYLTLAGDCAACHTARGSQPFAGGLAIDSPYGVIYSPNITPDKATGIGNWTDEQFYEALHDGMAPGHEYLYPAFPFPSFTRITRRDALAIKAYLFSLKPVHKPDRPNRLRFPYNIRQLLLGWRAVFFHEGVYKPDPDYSRAWNRGAYLVQGPGHCNACHTPRNMLGASKGSRFLAGGEIHGWWAMNITSNPEYGVGGWRVDQIAEFLKDGDVKGKTAALGEMRTVIHDSLQYLTDADRHAMAVYLKSVPSKPEQGVAEAGHGRSVSASVGAAVYRRHCAACHGGNGDGQSAFAQYPPLAGNPVVQSLNPVNVINVVLRGGFMTSTVGHQQPYSMPPFAHALSDRQIAGVVSYIRSHWGNQAGDVSTGQVRDRR